MLLRGLLRLLGRVLVLLGLLLVLLGHLLRLRGLLLRLGVLLVRLLVRLGVVLELVRGAHHCALRLLRLVLRFGHLVGLLLGLLLGGGSLLLLFLDRVDGLVHLLVRLYGLLRGRHGLLALLLQRLVRLLVVRRHLFRLLGVLGVHVRGRLRLLRVLRGLLLVVGVADRRVPLVGLRVHRGALPGHAVVGVPGLRVGVARRGAEPAPSLGVLLAGRELLRPALLADLHDLRRTVRRVREVLVSDGGPVVAHLVDELLLVAHGDDRRAEIARQDRCEQQGKLH